MTRTASLSLVCLSLLLVPLAFAQQPPPPMGHKMDMHGGGGHEGMEGGRGLGILPPGTWWKNPTTIAALTLTPDQQKKMDDLFLQSRISLIHLHASLEEEQLKLEPLLNVNPPDQAKTMAQISKVADLRADLEKTNAKMLLGLRSVLTADQWTKLQAEQHTRHERPAQSTDRHDGNGKGRGPGGPGARGGQDMPPPPPAPPTHE